MAGEPPLPTAESRLQVSSSGQVTHVRFLDRNILDETSIQQIGGEIAQLVEQAPNPKLLLIFENVEHLSSAALGTLITVNNKVRQKGGQLRLASIAPQIYEVFVITKLNQLFHIFETIDEAMASFK